ncbi:hypothetical protein nbrc107696_07930 [Gordonia spumicola]|uniref:Capsular polysaccharide biosynthesis protein n=1 Tax=Gordonia spumicola TaxID=589161 RepID=A0A7I9V527_9ACTN|nr:hypothetical protein [Gordonia spumicola]GEE00347.1 hypothetical protein nbrc107696_07930 [Gordonia spumicola]
MSTQRSNPNDVHKESNLLRFGPDLLGHFRNLLKALPIAIAVAVVAFAITLTITATADDEFEVTTVAQIDAQIPIMAGDVYIYQNNAPYLSLATTSGVREDIAHRMGSAWSAARVADNVSVTETRSPLLIAVTATAPTAEEAAKLSATTIKALDSASRKQRAGELDRAAATLTARSRDIGSRITAMRSSDSTERDNLIEQRKSIENDIQRIQSGGVNGLGALSTPSSDDARQTAPQSPALAVFVGLLTVLIAAEAVVFIRARFSRRATGSAIRRIADKHGATVEDAVSGDRIPALARTMLGRLPEGEHAVILRSAGIAEWGGFDGPVPEDVVVVDLDDAWIDQVDATVGLIVVMVVEGESIRADLDSTLSAIADLTIPVHVVMAPSAPPAEPEPEPEPEPLAAAPRLTSTDSSQLIGSLLDELLLARIAELNASGQLTTPQPAPAAPAADPSPEDGR